MPNAASTFLIIGERTNITGSPKFAKALKAGDWDACLAIARRILQAHHGDLALVSTGPGGTTMRVVLPLVKP